MPKKKNKKRVVTNIKVAEIVCVDDNYAELFTNPQKLAEVLQKDEWKEYEPLLTFKSQQGENLIHAIIRAPRELKLTRYIALLAKRGVNLNHLNNVFLPPIFLAIQLKHKEAVRSLYDADADLTVSNIDGCNILDIALVFSDPFELDLAREIYRHISTFLKLKKIPLTAGNFLIEAAEKGKLKSIIAWRKIANEWKLPVNINSQHPLNKHTALIAAVNAKQLEVVKYLIDNKADVTIKDYQDFNAFIHSIIAGDDEIFNLIASVDEELVNKIGAFGLLSPLQIAVEKNPKFVEPLLEKKANVNAENKNGSTALYNAIYFNNLPAINSIISHPSLNMLSYMPIECLTLAIRFGNLDVFEQLFSVINPTFDPEDQEEIIAELYKLAISLDKASHFKFMVEKGLNFYNYPNSPLNICCLWGNTKLIKWFFETQSKKITKPFIINSLMYAIRNSSKEIVVLLSNLSFEFFEKIKQGSEPEYYVYRNTLAMSCLNKNWLDLAIVYQPTLKFFITSNLFSGCDKYELLSIISYLEGVSCLSLTFWDEKNIAYHSPIFDSWYDQEIFSRILNHMPGMIDYIPDQKNPHHWVRFFYSNQPRANPIYIPPDFKSKSLTPFSFFRQQGLSDNEIHTILQERKTIPMLSFLDSKQTKNTQVLPCTWFGGQILCSHDYLLPIENARTPNAFLVIPDEFKKIAPTRSRWRFHPDNGLKFLEGMPAITVTLQFANDHSVEYKTKFTHEITWPRVKDRILCITLPVDNSKEQRGVLILAVYYLEGGLHHHRTQNDLPMQVSVRMPEPQLQYQNQQAIL